MISESYKQTAVKTIQSVVNAIAAKQYATIPKLIDRSDLPMEELEEFIEETLRLNGQKNIPSFSEADVAFYEDEDGEGFEVEYLLAVDGTSADMILAFEFLITETGLRSILMDVQPD